MTNSVHKQIGRNLRALRLARNVTLERLGKAVGVSYQQVQKYETGANYINPERMIHISNALGCEIADLYRGLIKDNAKPFDFDALISRSDLSIVSAYHAIRSSKQKAALLNLAKTLSEGEVNV